MKNVKSISSARAFKLVKAELEKSKADVIQYQALYEKLQVVTGRYFYMCMDLTFWTNFLVLLTIDFTLDVTGSER